MMTKVNKYKLIIFDCDGVLLNSNQIKTKAFYKVTLPYGEKEANAFVKYHVSNGGISRYKKFSYFLNHIVSKKVIGPSLNELLKEFSMIVKEELMKCELATELSSLRSKTQDSEWAIVSGGDQVELREVFENRKLDGLFNAGIFGSPDPKDKILSREFSPEKRQGEVLYLGDSKYDYKVAKKLNLDFIFVSKWSEVKDWESWTKNNKISVICSVFELLDE